jgi:acyl dehydratase
MPPRKLYFETVRAGDEIPALAKAPVDRVQLARFAGATGDFNPLHVDEQHARGLGMPSVYAPSTLGMSFLGQLITDWARGAQIRKFNAKFIKLIWPGDTIVCKGRVSDRHGTGGSYFIELEVWAENQKGELVLRGGCTLKVYFNAEDESRQRSGLAPLMVEVGRESLLGKVELQDGEKGKPAAGSKPAGKPSKPSKPAKKKPAPKKKPSKPAKKKKKR